MATSILPRSEGPTQSDARLSYRKETSSDNISMSDHGWTHQSSWPFLSRSVTAAQNPYCRLDEYSSMMGTTTSTNSPSNHSLTMSPTSKLQAPFLSIVLTKLNEILPEYSHYLSTPSYTGASLACDVLDSSVATATSNPNSPNESHKTSPKVTSSTKTGRQTRNSGTNTSSSPLSFQYWISSSSEHGRKQLLSSPTSSALALEGEWETFVAPFLLLAGAEVLAAEMRHLLSVDTMLSLATSLTGLYQRINQDLLRTQEILCEPFMRPLPVMPLSPTAASSVSNVQKQYYNSAKSLSSNIQLLVVMVAVRCQLIDLQVLLFSSSSSLTQLDNNNNNNNSTTTSKPDFSHAASAVTLCLQTVTSAMESAKRTLHDIALSKCENNSNTDETSTKQNNNVQIPLIVEPMMINVIQELKAWKYCLETCASLERCLFMETILSLRQWQINLPAKTCDTRFSHWMSRSYRDILSTLPVYFDRVHAFATPFYGFDTGKLWQKQGSNRKLSSENRSKDWDTTITDLLRKQDRLGGPPTAVAVVLNAVGANNLHVERGFRFKDDPVLETDNIRELWPAVYLRSTQHLTTGNLTATLRSSTHGSGILRSSQSSLLPSWSSPNVKPTEKALSNSPKATPTSPYGNDSIKIQQHVLEYDPDTGSVSSWPHTDWESVVLVLESGSDDDGSDRTFDSKIAVTYRYNDEDDAAADGSREQQQSISTVHEGAASLFQLDRLCGINNPEQINEGGTNTMTDRFLKKDGRQSTIHAISLGPLLNLVVLVRDREEEEEENRWVVSRRRGKLEDDEIRTFLNDVACKLRIYNIFTSDNILSHSKRQDVSAMLPLPCYDDNDNNNNTSLMIPWADDRQVQDFLADLKDIFNLRPINPYISDGSLYTRSVSVTPRTPASWKTPRGRRRRVSRSHKLPIGESAMSLFLGPELASLFY